MAEDPHEHLEWLRQNVNSYLKPMMVDILTERPADPRAFMIHWLETKGHSLGGGKPAQPPVAALHHSGTEEDEKDDAALKKLMDKKGKGKKKLAISAEAYGEYNKLGDYEPKVIPKSPEQIDQIKEVLKNSFMFKALEPKDMDIVISAMDIKTFGAEEFVIRQGDDGRELYIVSTGRLHCFKKFPDQPQPKFLCEYKMGGVFGELSLLYNVPRAASIKAIEPSTLFCVDRDTFNHIVKRAAIKRRELYDDFLNRVELLQELDPYERGKICDVLQSQTFKRGEFIIRQGEKGDKFYMIQEGTAEAIKTDERGESKVVFQYNANDYFGELALLHADGLRKASIRVTSDTMNVAWLERDSFERMLGPLKDILKRNTAKYNQYMQKT